MEYILIERRSQPGRNGVRMWRLTFYSLEDGSLWEMTVDPTYRNFRRSGWDHVVEHAVPWGAYQGLRRTQRRTQEGSGVLTADSAADITWRAEDLAQAQAIVEARERELNPTAFERIFDHAG
jgi:hypothetical protein